MPAFPSPLQAGGLAALLFLPAFAHAQTDAPSRITSVKLYPGSATVERTARVPAGSRSVTFRCLPQGLDARSLQVVADAPVRVGDIGVQVQERALAGGCASPLDERVRAAQDQLAASQAETDALELAHTYLKTVAGTAPTTQTSGPGTPGAGNISVTTDALRRSAQDTLMRLHQAKRRQEALELDVRALTAERDRIAGPRARVATVTVALAAEREGDVRLAYQVRGPSWSPSYRATLDSGAATVRLERLALVAQSTGEDWSGVPLVLSTGQPLGQTQGSLPRPWTLDVQPEPPAKPVAISMAAAPAPAPAALGRAAEVAQEAQPTFDVAIADGAYATEFTVPQRITVPSGGERITLSLGAQTVHAQLFTRTAPAVEPAAYLVAQLPALEGVWPAGPVQLLRDGAFVGNGRLDVAQLPRQGLSFGRDELVAVRMERPEQQQGTGGFIGNRNERRDQRVFVIENRHRDPIELQVLDAAPVSEHQDVRIESRYDPPPQDPAWNRQPGTVLWQQPLAAGATQRITAEHLISWPKDAQLREHR